LLKRRHGRRRRHCRRRRRRCGIISSRGCVHCRTTITVVDSETITDIVIIIIIIITFVAISIAKRMLFWCCYTVHLHAYTVTDE
jgi:hypothetical protein